MADSSNMTPYSFCIAGGAVLITSVLAYRHFKRNRKEPPKAPPNTVLMHQFDRAYDIPSLSLFCLKLETYLRMANIPYEAKLNSRFGQKGKLPWITYNGEDVADSEFIMTYLNNQRGVDLNRHLNPEDKAVARSFQTMIDERSFWIKVFFRFCHEKDTKLMKENHKLPFFVWWLMKRKIRNVLWAQGIGRHSVAEMKTILMADLAALSHYLGNNSFFMGDKPSQVDCSVFAFVAQLVYAQRDEDLGGLVQGHFPNLEQYCHRMKEKFWPDWNDCLLKRN